MSAINEQILTDIANEAIRAHHVHGENSMLYGSDEKSLRILLEEVGEVAHAMNELSLGKLTLNEYRVELEKELIQVAAMAGTWISKIRLEY